jgi:hypothetical protein
LQKKIKMRSLIIPVLVVILFSACKNNDKKAVPPVNSMGGIITDSSQFTDIQWMDSASRDFGKITEGQKLEVSFRFKNTGNKPLVIQRVQPSCGCTIAEQPNEPIAPGGEGRIKASFNSEGHVGINHKTLYVYANTKASRNNELHFAVEVEKKKW